MLVDACLDHESGTAESDRAWALVEDEAKPSKYADTLIQLKPEEGGRSQPLNPDPASWRCELDGSSENLWLNLSTGYVGGGRDQSAWGGPKGSNGALRHFESTGKKYPLVVKLGTISAAGAELYSYAPDEDGPVLDAKLAAHRKFWGINALSLEKTEKTTAELEVDANAKFEWSAIAEAGAKLEPLAGVGLLGLVNLGNSCYLNSVLQVVAATRGVREHFLLQSASDGAQSTKYDAADADTSAAPAGLSGGPPAGRFYVMRWVPVIPPFRKLPRNLMHLGSQCSQLFVVWWVPVDLALRRD